MFRHLVFPVFYTNLDLQTNNIKPMSNSDKTVITVEATVNAPLEKVWNIWASPEHIIQWSTPSPDWHTPKAENDLRTGGKFNSRMEAKDGSMGFDFSGTYTEVKNHELISYVLDDERKVNISFSTQNDETTVIETFEAETINSVEMQKAGWQAILDNFKKYTEAAEH